MFARFSIIRSMSTFLAWRNAFQHRSRAVTTMAGISFSILLMFMQIGFEQTARRSQTLLYEMLNFDLMMTSDHFESLKNPRDFPVARLFQARSIPGVEDVAALNVEWAIWTDSATEIDRSLMLVGIDLNPGFIRDARIRNNLDALRNAGTVMMDELSDPDLGPLVVDSPGLINERTVTIRSLFRMGTDFKSDGRAITGNAVFHVLQRQDPDVVDMGLIRVRPGYEIRDVKNALIGYMPDDVLIVDRDTFITTEQDYYTKVKPMGLFFQAGVFIAFWVGAVLLYQALATEITTRFQEYATMKSLGLRDSFLYLVGIQQALIYGLLSYGPALLISTGVFYMVHRATRVPIAMDDVLAVQVLGLTLLMCSLSGVFALQKVRRADPADLVE